MSRIGNKIITVPEGVTVEIADDNTVTVTGSKGTLVKQFSPAISFKQEGNEITVVRSSEEKHVKQFGAHQRGSDMTHQMSGFTCDRNFLFTAEQNPNRFTQLKVGVGSPFESFIEESFSIYVSVVAI